VFSVNVDVLYTSPEAAVHVDTLGVLITAAVVLQALVDILQRDSDTR
jgi:hypothetical protein